MTFGLKAAWGLSKLLLAIGFLPIVLIVLVVVGLIRVAIPILVIMGIVSLFLKTE